MLIVAAPLVVVVSMPVRATWNVLLVWNFALGRNLYLNRGRRLVGRNHHLAIGYGRVVRTGHGAVARRILGLVVNGDRIVLRGELVVTVNDIVVALAPAVAEPAATDALGAFNTADCALCNLSRAFNAPEMLPPSFPFRPRRQRGCFRPGFGPEPAAAGASRTQLRPVPRNRKLHARYEFDA